MIEKGFLRALSIFTCLASLVPHLALFPTLGDSDSTVFYPLRAHCRSVIQFSGLIIQYHWWSKNPKHKCTEFKNTKQTYTWNAGLFTWISAPFTDHLRKIITHIKYYEYEHKQTTVTAADKWRWRNQSTWGEAGGLLQASTDKNPDVKHYCITSHKLGLIWTGNSPGFRNHRVTKEYRV